MADTCTGATAMKRCTKCGDTKPITKFGKDAATRDGLCFRCKSCINKTSAAWKAANREKVKEIAAAWHAANADRLKPIKAAYYAANSDRLKAIRASWYAANRQKVRVNSTAWRAANPEKRRATDAAWRASNPKVPRIYKQNRRARMLESGGKLSKGIAEKLFKLQRGKCACCGLPLGDDYHLDHRMPLALGGANIDSNMQLLRATCNLQKSAKHPVDFMQSKGFLL